MWRPSAPSWVAPRLSPGAKGLGVALLVGVILGSAPAAQATWGILYLPPPKVVRTPEEQAWLRDIPERPGARSRGKVAVFVFKGDDVYQPVRAAVVQMLRRRGFNVTVTLRPVDSATEFREMSQVANLAVYVQGEMSGEGARQSAHIHVYSGVTGHRIASARFSGPTAKIVGDLGHTFWTRVGPAILRTCSSVARPRRLEREPLRIEAGEPLENTPPASEAEGT
jgi:hypothetical protein